MTVDHSDHEVVGGAHRSVQQLVFTATQLVEVIARMRAHNQAWQADADRAAAATDTAAADRAGRDRAEQRAAITQDRQHWAPVSDPGWRRDAEPEQLLTAWAAATTWAGHDPAAAAMTRTEAEIRHRWPGLGDRYDRLRVADGLHPAAAMSLAVREAAAAGWDPAEPADNPAVAEAAADTAREWQGRAGQEQQAATQAATTPDDPTTPRVDGPREGVHRAGGHDHSGAAAAAQAGVAADVALRWHPPVGSIPESRLTDHGLADRGQTGRLPREPRPTTRRNGDAAPRSR